MATAQPLTLPIPHEEESCKIHYNLAQQNWKTMFVRFAEQEYYRGTPLV